MSFQFLTALFYLPMVWLPANVHWLALFLYLVYSNTLEDFLSWEGLWSIIIFSGVVSLFDGLLLSMTWLFLIIGTVSTCLVVLLLLSGFFVQEAETFLLLLIPFRLTWIAYVSTWWAAMEYKIWLSNSSNNPLAVIIHVIKGYAGVMIYTGFMLGSMFLVGKHFIPTKTPTGIIMIFLTALFYLYQRAHILTTVKALPYPDFVGTTEDYQEVQRMIDRNNRGGGGSGGGGYSSYRDYIRRRRR